MFPLPIYSVNQETETGTTPVEVDDQNYGYDNTGRRLPSASAG